MQLLDEIFDENYKKKKSLANRAGVSIDMIDKLFQNDVIERFELTELERIVDFIFY